MARHLLLFGCFMWLFELTACPGSAGEKGRDPAEDARVEAVLKFGDSAVSRRDLLSRFEDFTRQFPKSPHVERFNKDILILRRMIAEDAAHVRKPLEEMSKKEQIAELIYQLREQKGHETSNWRQYDIFGTSPKSSDKESGPSPAHRLLEMGYDAVPQLIEVLEDERLTRCASNGWSQGHYYHVLRVGDCSLAILTTLTGRSFYRGDDLIASGKAKKVKDEARAWWEQFRQKGEKQMWIEGTEAGDQNSVEQARRLLAKYPSAGLVSLRVGTRKAVKDRIRCDMINSVRDFPGDEVLPFLREELKGPFLTSRLAAARELLKRGRDDGVGAMIRDWQKLPPNEAKGPSRWEISELCEFLLASGKVQAVRAIATDFGDRSVDVRVDALIAISTVMKDLRDQPLDAGVRRAMDALLVQALDDKSVFRGTFSFRGAGKSTRKEMKKPRVCDVASQLFVSRLKRDDLFELSAPLEIRDRQIRELKNLWRDRKSERPADLQSAGPE